MRAGALRGDLVDAYDLALECELVGDDEQDERWHRVAAGGGDPRALCNLGAFLARTGREQEGLRFLVAAAEAGNILGACNAGVLHEILGDDQQAERWFRIAATGGEQNARNWLLCCSTAPGVTRKQDRCW